MAAGSCGIRGFRLDCAVIGQLAYLGICRDKIVMCRHSAKRQGDGLSRLSCQSQCRGPKKKV